MTSEIIDAGEVSSSLYKFVDLEGLKRILGGSIRFTQPSAFNDPFELLPEIVMPTGEAERKIKVQFDILGKRRNPPIGAIADEDEIPDGHSSSDATSRDIVDQLNGVIGFYCLSRNSDSLLMWSHYADQYAGAMVEFDASHEFFANPIEIEYRDRRPRRHLSMYLTDEPLPLSELCVKSTQWGYERESRIVRRLVDCVSVGGKDCREFPIFTQPIPLDAIKSVILGERMPHKAMRGIYEQLKDTEIAIDLAAVDLSGFGFRRERIKYPVPFSQMGPWMTPRTANIFADLNTVRGEFARALLQAHPMSKIVNKPV